MGGGALSIVCCNCNNMVREIQPAMHVALPFA